MKKLLVAGLLMVGSANAQELRANVDGYSALGTAWRVVSSTQIAVNSGTTITTWTSTSVPALYRLVASAAMHINAPARTVTPTVGVSTTLLPANQPEYFIFDKFTNLAVTRDSADGVLNITKMKK